MVMLNTEFMEIELRTEISLQFLTFKTFNREKIMRVIGFHEMFAFMVIPFLLLGYIGYIFALFLVFFPAIWLGIFLKIMYGRFMPAI